MNQLLDTNTHKDLNAYPLVELVEAYILRKRNGTPIIERNFKIKFSEMGYSPDQIDQIILEMRVDANEELRSGVGEMNARRNLIIASIAMVASLLICLTVNLGKAITIPVLVFALSSFVISRAYSEMHMDKKRKKRRFLKYKNWSVDRVGNHDKNLPDFADNRQNKQDLNNDHFFQP